MTKTALQNITNSTGRKGPSYKKIKKAAARKAKKAKKQLEQQQILPPPPPIDKDVFVPPTSPAAVSEVVGSTPIEPIVPFPPTPPPGNQQSCESNDDEVVGVVENEVGAIVLPPPPATIELSATVNAPPAASDSENREVVMKVVQETVDTIITAACIAATAALKTGVSLDVASPVKTITITDNDKTPMAHIKLGSLSLSEETKMEISTPNEREVMRALTRKISGKTRLDTPIAAGMKSDKKKCR